MDSKTAEQNGTKQADELLKKENYIEIEIPFNLYEYLSSEDCNVQNMCRICLSTDNDVLYPLLATKENSILTHMYIQITNIQLCAEDGLPSSICEPCQTQMVHCYEFKSKCEKSNYMLKSLLKEYAPVKDELSDQNIMIKQEQLPENNLYEGNKLDDVMNNDAEFVEDVQYLEDISDASDNDNLCIVQKKNTRTRKKARKYNHNDDSGGLLKRLLKRKKQQTPKKQKGKTLTCLSCPKVFTKLMPFQEHMRTWHPNVKYPHFCGQCLEPFNSEHDLKVHSVLHTKGNPWKCNQCQKEFAARSALRRHIQRHMESKRYSCDICDKAFTEMYALRRHVRVHTGEHVEKKHACSICDKRYSESGLLAAHMSRHGGLRPCACDCGKRFSSARLLASHRLVHSDRKPYACRYCDKRFRHESTRNTHHRTHTGEKPYVCSTCGKSFIQNSNLTLHMRTHTGERPYACSQCDRKFASGSSLKTHERIHSGERPYSCTICGKRFTRKNLNAHMRKHTGERPFACSVCPKKFANATRLRDHCRIHTGEKPFECSMCTQKFSTKSQQIKHVKSHQTQKKKRADRGVVIVQQDGTDPVPVITDRIMFNKEHGELITVNENVAVESMDNEAKEHELTLNIVQEVPLEVTGELVLDDSNLKTELLVVDNSHNYQENTLLNANNMNIVEDDVNYDGDVNLMTLNGGEVSISTSNLDGTTVKLYQLDQSLVQIHSAGGQVTISKITSKMTANF